MSTSIPVLNRNHSLPPLLLPASRPVSGVGSSAETRQDPFSTGSNGKRSGSLEGLTQLATKRARIDATGGSDDGSNSVPLPLLFASPIPLVGSSAPKSGSVSSVSSMSSFSDSSASPHVGVMFGDYGIRDGVRRNSDYATATERKSSKLTPPPTAPCMTRERNSPRSSASGPSSGSGSNSSKRQRVGPSCDGCRLKKIKCDAHVEIVLQDPRVVSQISNKLHQVVSRDQVSQMDLKVDISNIPMDSVLVKHIDKIVMFKPCTSCNKRRASLDGSQGPLDGRNDNVTGGVCVFSKGFTRADINVFVKICKKVGGKPVQEMTVEDYHEAGF
ncbi:hypothetical protein ZYGR_0S01100 [Zygosaccharomyces rouxii]|uniref:ZYRO0F04928p n=2 Tax=Zygosaccharomyces rouxii TaxID=4956 RepID=C5DXG8_ZYGRC|nr:uncharacterized protein ZYRO0F04928g [Zygosaccharomyces rouxii]KAH9199240.1 hypothetical protein LQ764DRAFT_128054 [Zygosaccharomyces rouxii]GAV49977.1 hypothetical protein ZYGR_0S01100 [Zygosaccharomyces rouxii]CAR28479.1 ZYRO0F04928p [Zygosaccharomyces rouxii]